MILFNVFVAVLLDKMLTPDQHHEEEEASDSHRVEGGHEEGASAEGGGHGVCRDGEAALGKDQPAASLRVHVMEPAPPPPEETRGGMSGSIHSMVRQQRQLIAAQEALSRQQRELLASHQAAVALLRTLVVALKPIVPGLDSSGRLGPTSGAMNSPGASSGFEAPHRSVDNGTRAPSRHASRSPARAQDGRALGGTSADAHEREQMHSAQLRWLNSNLGGMAPEKPHSRTTPSPIGAIDAVSPSARTSAASTSVQTTPTDSNKSHTKRKTKRRPPQVAHVGF